MLSHTNLKKNVQFILSNQPYQVLESSMVFKGRGRSVVQTKIKNLINGIISSRTFHQNEQFEEADIGKIKLKFLYYNRGKYFFSRIEDQSKRLNLTEEYIGASAKFLKPNQIIDGLVFQGKIINVSLPIKVQLRVISAPPGIRAGRAEAGTKQVVLETNAKINVPLFIKEGDIIEINVENGEYVRRVE